MALPIQETKRELEVVVIARSCWRLGMYQEPQRANAYIDFLQFGGTPLGESEGEGGMDGR